MKKKTLLLPLALLAGVICMSLVNTPKEVVANGTAKYEANIHPVNISLEGDAAIYSDNYLYKMVDGDETTNAWFQSAPTSITIDYGKAFLLYDVDIFNGIVEDTRDFYQAGIQYSLDGNEWTTIENLYENADSMYRDVVLDYWSNPIETRFIKLSYVGDSNPWVAITELSVNTIEKKISYENLELEDPVYGHADISHMIDDDNSTFTWFKSQTTENGTLILSYAETIEVSQIELMMAKVGSTNDYMASPTLFYAVDDNMDWIEIATVEGQSIRHILETPITLKHIKAVAGGVKENGLVVREFSVHSNNSIKLDNLKEYADFRDGGSSEAYPELINNVRNLNDGNTNTYTDLKPESASKVGSIINDLGNVKEVTGITVLSGGPTWGDNFTSASGKILTSMDGVTYTDITSQFIVDEGNYTLTETSILARFVKLEIAAGAWVTIGEFTVEANEMFTTGLSASFGGGYSDDFTASSFGLRFLLPVAGGTATTDYKAVVKAGTKEVTYTVADNLVETNGNLKLTLLLGDIVNNFGRLSTEFTVSSYYKDGLTGDISYSVESIVREYLYLYLVEKVTLTDDEVSFLTKLNNYVQVLNGGVAVEPETPVEKVDPVFTFSIENGTKLTIGVDAAPTVTGPEDLTGYEVYFEDGNGTRYDEFPTTAGAYSLVVHFDGNDQYNSTHQWRTFTLVEDKLDPEITITYGDGTVMENGVVFKIGDAEPVVTVTEGLTYVTYYEQNEVKVSDTMPTTAGTYSFIVEVTGNDQYNSARIWRWFVIE